MKLPPARYALRISDRRHLTHQTEVVVTKNQVLALGPVMLKARDADRK